MTVLEILKNAFVNKKLTSFDHDIENKLIVDIIIKYEQIGNVRFPSFYMVTEDEKHILIEDFTCILTKENIV